MSKCIATQCIWPYIYPPAPWRIRLAFPAVLPPRHERRRPLNPRHHLAVVRRCTSSPRASVLPPLFRLHPPPPPEIRIIPRSPGLRRGAPSAPLNSLPSQVQAQGPSRAQSCCVSCDTDWLSSYSSTSWRAAGSMSSVPCRGKAPCPSHPCCPVDTQ
jgi:hypothetical protein